MTDASTGPLVPLPAGLVDARGTIQPLVDGEVRSVLLITAVKGSVRGNHYHRTDWHYCYVVTGAIEYHYRPHGSTASPDRVLVPAGAMFFTPAEVEHAMSFPEDTVFVTCSGSPRDTASYEADLVRVELLSSRP